VDNARMDESYQTITIRNARGQDMVQTAVAASRLRLASDPATGKGSHEKIASVTVLSDSIVLAMRGGAVKEAGLPKWIAELMAFALRNIGPKGINFARYSIDYHILRNYLHVLDVWGPERAKTSIPEYAQDIIDYYLKTDPAMASLDTQIRSKSKQIK
jgi:hypothetical protein